MTFFVTLYDVAFVSSRGLADLPPRICYELCFGETFREDPEKRCRGGEVEWPRKE